LLPLLVFLCLFLVLFLDGLLLELGAGVASLLGSSVEDIDHSLHEISLLRLVGTGMFAHSGNLVHPSLVHLPSSV